jgi:hypothetical protein
MAIKFGTIIKTKTGEEYEVVSSLHNDFDLKYLKTSEIFKGSWYTEGFFNDCIEKRDWVIISERPETKKIVGYKAPIDLFNGRIPKGTLYKPAIHTSMNTYCSVDEKGNIIDNGITNLPYEIVETWEPVYEEEYKVGDWIYFITDVESNTQGKVAKITSIGPDERGKAWIKYEPHGPYGGAFRWEGGAFYSGQHFRKATQEEIKEATSLPTIEGYKTEPVFTSIQGGTSAKLTVGCKEFTRDELLSYKKLLSITEKTVSLKIGKTEITLELINKLLKALN